MDSGNSHILGHKGYATHPLVPKEKLLVGMRFFAPL